MFDDIRQKSEWESIERISKGWSADEKYYIRTREGKSLLLRCSDIGKYEAKKKEYEMIKRCSQLGFLMSAPVDFGICNQGKTVFMLLTWMEGEDLEQVLPRLSADKQYMLGRKAGAILKKIHSLPVEQADIPQDTKKEKKLAQLSRYEQSQVRMEQDQAVIDFNRWKVGDPYEEFYKLESFGTELSIPYCIGQIDEYFDDHIPEAFWAAHAVYTAHASLHSIVWAEKFGQQDIDRMKERCRRIWRDYNDFALNKPGWYTENYRACVKNP